MPKPIVFLVDDDPETLPMLTAALERRFGADYQILGDASSASALAKLESACATGECVALLMASDLDFLARAHDACPGASRCVLVSFGDQEAYVSVRRALVLGEVETMVLKQWGHPEERLYPVVSELLRRWVHRAHSHAVLCRIGRSGVGRGSARSRGTAGGDRHRNDAARTRRSTGASREDHRGARGRRSPRGGR